MESFKSGDRVLHIPSGIHGTIQHCRYASRCSVEFVPPDVPEGTSWLWDVERTDLRKEARDGGTTPLTRDDAMTLLETYDDARQTFEWATTMGGFHNESAKEREAKVITAVEAFTAAREAVVSAMLAGLAPPAALWEE